MRIGSTWFRNWLPEAFGIDLRSLALFRILLGTLLLADLAARAPDLVAFYTDRGVFPAESYRDMHDGHAGTWSLHALNGSPAYQGVLFLVAGIAALSMLVGYRTKLAAFVSFVLLVSLHTRNPLVLNGGDVLLRVAHFWVLFLPVGARWSLDCRRRETSAPAATRVLSVASAALLLQIAMVYWFGAALKTGDAWRTEFTAVHDAFANVEIAKPLAEKLLLFPDLLALLTRATMVLEVAGPLLAFVPFFTARLRCAAAALFIGFHLVGIFLTLSIGHFAFVGAAVWVLFLPGSFWEKLGIAGNMTPRGARPASRGASWINHGVAGCALLYVFAWNVRSTDFEKHARYFPREASVIGRAAGLQQKWSMFAPKPIGSYGWFLAKAEFGSGSQPIDLFSGAAYSEAEPPSIRGTFPNARWRKYLENLRKGGHAPLRKPLIEFLGRRHTASDRITRTELVFMRVPSPPVARSKTRRISLHQSDPDADSLVQSAAPSTPK